MDNILFLCTGNSCRSQMAEGWAKKLHQNRFNFYSAGTKRHDLNSYAVKVMQEAGVDISNHYSKTIEDLPDISFKSIFTVCSDANENCPVFTGGKIIHVGFDDPPRLCENIEDEQEKLKIYRRVRDQIKNMVENIDHYLNK